MKNSAETTTCPITRKVGKLLRTKEPNELFEAYSTISKIELTKAIKDKYFKKSVSELYSPASDLRWYHPSKLGESDFYEQLSTSPYYYNLETWDKLKSLEILQRLQVREFIDIGCGEGWLVKKANELGISGSGIDINEKAIKEAKSQGLPLYLPSESTLKKRKFEAIVSLQTLEHISDPVDWLNHQVSTFSPRHIIIAVPAHDTMLGRTNDPLCWPPHHFTLWSAKSIHALASKLNLQVHSIEYEPNTWARFNSTLNREGRRNFNGTFQFPKGNKGKLLFKICQLLNIPWACRAHTLIAHLKTKEI